MPSGEVTISELTKQMHKVVDMLTWQNKKLRVLCDRRGLIADERPELRLVESEEGPDA